MTNKNDFVRDLLRADGIDPTGPTDSERAILKNRLDKICENKHTGWGTVRREIGSLIMQNRRIQYLTVAMMLVTVLVGIHYFNGSIDGASIVWADVAKQLETMSSFKARSHRVFEELVEDGRTMTFEGIRHFSPDHGFMEETTIDGKPGLTFYASWSDRELTVVCHPIKQYYQFPIDDEMLSLIAYLNPADTEGIVKLFGTKKCTELGRRDIDGVSAQGFEIKEIRVFSRVPKILFQLDTIDVRLWINEKTMMPIELEAEGQIGKGLLTGFKNIEGKETITHIEYNPDFDESILEPHIPDDYTLINPGHSA